MTYQELGARLQGRCKQSRKLGHNTYAERAWNFSSNEPIWDGPITIRFHRTDILTFYSNGDIVINSGGWYTITTKERLNRYLPEGYGVYSWKGLWWLWSQESRKPFCVFRDGMTLRPDGFVDNTQYYAEWDRDRLNQIREHRREVLLQRGLCWTWTGTKYCNLMLSAQGRCARHGKPALPGHDKED